MRSILVQADRGPTGAARLETALSLARMTGGHVTAVVDTPLITFAAVDPLGGAVIAGEALREAVRADDAYAEQIDERLGREDVPTTVLRAEGEPLEALSRAARLADLAIVARGNPVAGDLPMAVRCPVLAVDGERPLTFPLANAAIGWDGGAEAAAALRGVVPLLAGCPSVSVLSVEDSPHDWPATDALEYLSRHGVHAELVTLTRTGSIEETLRQELALRGSAVFAMGAYGHSRVREFLFGGVTRTFLEWAGGPSLLLAH